MRRVVSDLITLTARRPRPRPNGPSRQNRDTVNNNVLRQRRYNSKTATQKNLAPAKESVSSTSSTAEAAPGAASSSAGAAVASSSAAAGNRRTAWEILKASPIGRFGSWYSDVALRRPYATQVWSSFVVYLAGDLSAQLLFPTEVKMTTTKMEGNELRTEETMVKTGYDPLRTLRHLTVGVVASIPGYKWFMFLHHNFNYASKFLSIATKVVVQQIVYTPIFSTYFFSMQSLLTGASLSETWERLKIAVPNSLMNSVKLWPAVMAFNFMYVPVHFRMVFGGTVAVGWQTYLSWLNQKAAREVAAAEAVDDVVSVVSSADRRLPQAA